jgi:hypothetical protein
MGARKRPPQPQSNEIGYEAFLASKAQQNAGSGFEPIWLPDFLFDFQRHLVDYAIRQGRAAIFADCGLGKTPMALVWAENVVRKTNKPVLLLTPLAVGPQMLRKAEFFGVDAARSRDGSFTGKRVIITNYQQLHRFNPDDFGGAVGDESSCIKDFEARTTAGVKEFLRRLPYRLLDTATAAPNDYTELGTTSEALGYLGHMDMLSQFFKNDQGNSIKAMRSRRFELGAGRDEVSKWRFKGHAEIPFWRWVCSWARAMRRPSDLGFSDERFKLPELIQREHLAEARTLADGMLFALPAVGLKEQRDERKRTVRERCERAAQLCEGHDLSVSWCQLNAEGDLLETLVSGSRQIKGSQTDEEREELYEAFSAGQLKKLVIKDSIGAFGLDWPHCAHTTLFPSHSYERYYQAIRRFWRFGQTRPVTVDIVGTEGDAGVLKNMLRKQDNANRMFDALVREMRNALAVRRNEHDYNKAMEIPAWL